jgi:uncharacterized membrane protein
MNPWELHPALVHFPLAFLLSTTALDVAAYVQERKDPGRLATRLLLIRLSLWLLVAGLLVALPTALAGVLAYLTVPSHSEEAQARIGVHALLNASSVILYTVLLIRRWNRPAERASRTDIGLSLAGALLLTAGGTLGGYLVYRDGVGTPDSRDPEGTSMEHLERLFDDDGERDTDD